MSVSYGYLGRFQIGKGGRFGKRDWRELGCAAQLTENSKFLEDSPEEGGDRSITKQ